jgi:hypothetical protein
VWIPTPGIDSKALESFFAQASNNIVGLVNMFSGGALENFSIFALGIMPYISASIILQLLTVVIPYLEKLSKEGELGRRKITQYTRYSTVVLAPDPELLHLDGPRGRWRPRRALGRPEPGLAFRLMADDHAHDRHRVHHVARRADHERGHRKRHLADHLLRHRRVGAVRRSHDVEYVRSGELSLFAICSCFW